MMNIVQDFLSYDCNGTITYDFRVKPFIHKYKQYLPDNFEEIYTEYFKGNMYRYAVLKDNTIDVLKRLKENYKLIDVCNAPGGKSFTASQYMNNTGEIYSCDIHAHRVELIKSGAERLGIKNIIPTKKRGVKKHLVLESLVKIVRPFVKFFAFFSAYEIPLYINIFHKLSFLLIPRQQT